MSPKTHRPTAMQGFTVERMTDGCGKIYTTITFDKAGKPSEVFITFGKAGGCGSAIADGIARLASYGLRSGLDPLDAIKALQGICCHKGSSTCMTVVAESLRLVLKALSTGRDINDIIEDHDLCVNVATEITGMVVEALESDTVNNFFELIKQQDYCMKLAFGAVRSVIDIEEDEDRANAITGNEEFCMAIVVESVNLVMKSKETGRKVSELIKYHDFSQVEMTLQQPALLFEEAV